MRQSRIPTFHTACQQVEAAAGRACGRLGDRRGRRHHRAGCQCGRQDDDGRPTAGDYWVTGDTVALIDRLTHHVAIVPAPDIHQPSPGKPPRRPVDIGSDKCHSSPRQHPTCGLWSCRPRCTGSDAGVTHRRLRPTSRPAGSATPNGSARVAEIGPHATLHSMSTDTNRLVGPGRAIIPVVFDPAVAAAAVVSTLLRARSALTPARAPQGSRSRDPASGRRVHHAAGAASCRISVICQMVPAVARRSWRHDLPLETPI